MLKSTLLALSFYFALAGLEAVPAVAPYSIPASFAGSWYNADPKALSKELDAWMDAAGKQDFEGVPMALIQPHAGYVYSGKAMACGAALLRGSGVERVIILGPSHRAFLRNAVCVPEASSFETPLGPLQVDAEAVRLLRESPFVVANDKVQAAEHSVQMQLPMLRAALGPDFKIVPAIVGSLDSATEAKVADALRPLLGPKTLLVVSSDFTHYGPNYDYVPFREDVRDNLEKLDKRAFETIKSLDSSAFSRFIAETGDTICGERGIAVLLRLLPKDAKASLLKYDSSGAQSGDFSNSVSYLSIAFSGRWPDKAPAETSPSETKSQDAKPSLAKDVLSDDDKAALLQLARKSIAYCFMAKRPLPVASSGLAFSAAAKKPMGAFVTLTIDGELRGCIGEIQAVRPLCDAVAARACDAAFSDSRFEPLRKDELERARIEISALTPPRKIDSCDEIALGRHGVVLYKAGHSAVFLPQVALEQGWTLEQTLSQLCLKAHLPPDAWRSGATFQVFEAVVFSEPEPKR